MGQRYIAEYVPDEIVLPGEAIDRHLRGDLEGAPGTLIVRGDGTRPIEVEMVFDNGRAIYVFQRAAVPFEAYVPPGWQEPRWFHLAAWYPDV